MNKLNINKIKMLLPLSLMICGNMVSADSWSFFSCCLCPDIPKEAEDKILEPEISPLQPQENPYSKYGSKLLDEESDSEVPEIEIVESNTPLQIKPNNSPNARGEYIYCTTLALLEQGIKEFTNDEDTVEFTISKLSEENNKTTFSLNEKILVKKGLKDPTYTLYDKVVVPTKNIMGYDANGNKPNVGGYPLITSSLPFAGSDSCRYKAGIKDGKYILTVYNNCWTISKPVKSLVISI